MTNLISQDLQPNQSHCDFDLGERLDAVVSLKATIPEDAFTAEILGTERHGHGAVIAESGLIATIGYLVTEADSIWIQGSKGQMVAGDLIGYDYESGFGLIQPLGSLDIKPFSVGSIDNLAEGSQAILAGFGGREQSITTEVVAKAEFVGYWEYIVEEAIYTAPAHPNWGGAALIGPDGKLYGIGSLYTQEVPGLTPGAEGNMVVPIDLLTAIQGELTRYGQTLKPARPWLGMFAAESDEGLVVAGVYDGAPAAEADLHAGDEIVSINGHPPLSLGDLFRSIWSLGSAGTTIPIKIRRDGQLIQVHVRSSDRRSHWKTPKLH
ncbi:MAG: S1C family serine protease [Gammaproteobacteria bacterium]